MHLQFRCTLEVDVAVINSPPVMNLFLSEEDELATQNQLKRYIILY